MNAVAGALRHGVLALLAAACAGAAATEPTTVIESSAASQCLQSADPKLAEPEYPFDEYKRAQSGRVVLALRFTAPDRAPEVEVLGSEGGEAFVGSVRRYAAALRVPCLAAGQTAALTQEYVFQTNQERVWIRRARDAQAGRREELLACRTHTRGERSPLYPISARREGISGNVFARLRYTAPDKPPELLQVAHVREAQALGRAVRFWVPGYRLPCMVPGQDEPVEMTMMFMFRFEGDEERGFLALTLPQFMQRVRGIDKQRLQLDTTTMGCPFDLLLTYRRPYMPNTVSSVDDVAEPAAREPLLVWLRDAELTLQGRLLAAVYGDTADITVPCIKIDLKPKE